MSFMQKITPKEGVSSKAAAAIMAAKGKKTINKMMPKAVKKASGSC